MQNGKLRRTGSGSLPVAAVVLLLLLSPAHAQAHTTFQGLGEFASGFLHPLTTPPHLLVLLALGLWLGQHAPLQIKDPALAFAGTAAAGLLLTGARHISGVYPPVLIIVGLCIGIFVVIGLPMPLWIKLATCGVAAFVVALDSGVDAGVSGAATAKILAATWVSLVLCLINLAFYVSLLPRVRWVQTGVRVVGSWIVAIAFLLLAFALRR